jgi:hypothetical protein
VEQDAVHGGDDGHVMMMIMLYAWKKKKEKKWPKAKVY